MKYLVMLSMVFSIVYAADTVVIQQSDAPLQQESQIAQTDENMPSSEPIVLAPKKSVIISVVGQGVAPMNTTSPAQAYALAKRAAIADGYRLIAEKVKGVEIQGQDLVKNMMVQRSTVRTAVHAVVSNANVVETTFRDGLCEVEMEIKLSYEDLVR